MKENHHPFLPLIIIIFTISDLKKDLKASRLEIESMSKSYQMLNLGANDLNKILNVGKQVDDRKGVRFREYKNIISKNESFS